MHYTLQKDNTKNLKQITRKGIARPQSQFPHSVSMSAVVYIFPRSVYSAAGKYVDRSWEYIIAHRHMNVEIGIEARNSFSGIHKCGFRCSARPDKKNIKNTCSEVHCVPRLWPSSAQPGTSCSSPAIVKGTFEQIVQPFIAKGTVNQHLISRIPLAPAVIGEIRMRRIAVRITLKRQ